MKTITSQRQWQLKQVALGKCSICRKKIFKGELCKNHYDIHKEKCAKWHIKNKEKHLLMMKIRRNKMKK